jgi:succinate dehydrogenase / fumarate reductase, cytochrome b subunit
MCLFCDGLLCLTSISVGVLSPGMLVANNKIPCCQPSKGKVEVAMVTTLNLYRTTIGKKVVMAVTGIILVGFLVGHMLGNLKAFDSPEHLNQYGTFLRSVGYPVLAEGQALWVVRLVLLASIVLHMVAAVQLTRRDRESRQQRYAVYRPVQATYASRTMIWGGIIIALFVVYHILHFTIGAAHPDFHHGEVYNNLVIGFQNPLVVGFYILAMAALALHLYHGVWSMFQTLGLNNAKWNQLLRWLSIAVAVGLFVGFISVPVAVQLGILTL